MRKEKKRAHKDFWAGRGGGLIFVPSSQMPQYDLENYKQRFEDPRKMYEAEMERARAILDWPTDGIATIRPNLGTIYIPAIAGQEYRVLEGQMPWPGPSLSLEAIAAIKNTDIYTSELLKRANAFYEIVRQELENDICAYLPDTQGVFDILHLLRGDPLFYELIDSTEQIKELLDIVTRLYIEISRANKEALGESMVEMVHGHGTQQGLYFPHAGIRLSEDTATLLSPQMVDEYILPYMEKAAKPFGGAFVHFCGKHKYLYEQIVQCDYVRAIDLGNPEMYDTMWLFDRCAETNTVFYGKVAALPEENWQAYIRRLAKIVKKSGVRCVLRPVVFPEEKKTCAEMQQMWHELTS